MRDLHKSSVLGSKHGSLVSVPAGHLDKAVTDAARPNRALGPRHKREIV